MKTPLQQNVPLLNRESPSLCTRMGGLDAIQRLVEAFFRRVDDDPVLLALYGSHHRCAIEGLTRYLSQILGGAPLYAEEGYYVSLAEAHARFKIGTKERDAWLNAMRRALDDVALEAPIRATLRDFFDYSSMAIINRPAATPDAEPPSEPSPSQELEARWQAQLCIEEIAGAIKEGDSARVLAALESAPLQAYLQSEKAIFASVLCVIGRSDNPDLLGCLREGLAQSPDLIGQRVFCGGTLLHSAAEAGSPQFVRLLLEFGADANALNDGGHTPLERACNASAEARRDRAEVVRLLLEFGANPNAIGGVKRSAPLHAAARRGSVSVARVLLEQGAEIEARDGGGDTPLRRAINCGKAEMTEFLLSQGADVYSKGSGGLEAWQAARTAKMKQILQSYLAHRAREAAP